MTNSSPDQSFRFDKDTFHRLRKDPAALDSFLNNVIEMASKPFRTHLQEGRISQLEEAVMPAPPLDVEALLPLSPAPKKAPVPGVKVAPAPVVAPVVEAPKSVPARPSFVSPVATQRPTAPEVMPSSTHRVNVAVPQSIPIPAAPTVTESPISEAPSISEAPLHPADPVKVDRQSGLTSKDISEAEKRRQDRERALSDLLKSDRGEIL